MRLLNFNFIALILTISSISCTEDPVSVTNPDPEHEEELITTVKITLTDTSNSANIVEAKFADLDGEGGDAPSAFDTIRLQKSTVYKGQIELLNESESPSENITEEIEEEGDEHLFCFTSSSALTITSTDSDGTYPIGLQTLWKTTSDTLSDGFVLVTLKHQPDIKDGTCSPGETDIELNFILQIID